MNGLLRKVLFILLMLFSIHLMVGQTGIYPYGTFDNKGFDTINIGNLNAHFSINVLNKPGRGLPFYYRLSYDSLVWHVTSVNGASIWNPVPEFGWRGDAEAETGYISFNEQSLTTTCGSGSGRVPETRIYGVTYHDPYGVSHPFPGVYTDILCPGGDRITNSIATKTNDGSGYQLAVDAESNGGSPNGPVINREGAVFTVPFNTPTGGGNITDSNGNVVSTDGSGHFADTTGNVVLTVAGRAPNPHTFTYTDANGNPQTVTINYKTYTVQTAFGCSGIGEYGPASTPLVDSISLPDGSTYHFAYEATPNGSGNVTGRLASVTLPQGGAIHYSYTGSNTGIVCADGSIAGMTRTISSDSGSAGSTCTYNRSNVSAATSHTDVVDGFGNQTAYDFVIPANQPNIYETKRIVYQGTASNGTQLLSKQTCYNGATPDCTTSAFALPVDQIDTYESLNGAQQHGSTLKYNTYGLPTEEDDHDFGGSARGNLTRKEVWAYANKGIVGLVSADSIYDGGGTLASLTNYNYDESTPVASSNVPHHVAVTGPRGNLTTMLKYASSSLTDKDYALTTYEDTGSPLTVTTPNGTIHYSYDASFVFNNGVTPPTPSSGVSLPTNATYDANTGLPTSTTDPNGTQIKYTYDSMLRPTEIDMSDSGMNPVGKTTVTYWNPTNYTVYSYQSASALTTGKVLLDAYGRKSRVASANGQSSNPYYQQDICYDANGNIGFQSYSYQSTGFNAAKICSGSGDSYTYDALGRVTTITHADGTGIQYSYSGRATKVTDENGVSRITQVDGLGRITRVCELSGNSLQGDSPVSCGTDIAGTGYVTTYSYDLANHKVTIQQGQQTRIFQTDWLGRPILVQEPERGTTTYSYAYNSTGLVVTRKRPKANQTNPSVLTTTTTQYDALGRVVSISYDDGTPNRTFAYDQAQVWGNSGISTGAAKGRLTAASSSVNGQAFVYDALGRIISNVQCLPSSCGQAAKDKWLYYTYDWLGNLLSATDGAGVKTLYHGYTPANEVTSITSSLNDATHPGTLMSNAQYGPNGPLHYQLGNGLTAVFSYDSLGRRNGGWVCKNSSQPNCSGGTYGFALGWKGIRVTSVCDTALNNCRGFGYDDFNRLISQTITSGAGQNYSWVYDRYGNRWQENPNGAQMVFNKANNQITTSGYSYDAAGNLISDGVNPYSYDAEGNLVQEITGSGTVKFSYNALNQQVRTDWLSSGSAAEVAFNLSGQLASLWWASDGSLLLGKAYLGSIPLESYLLRTNMAYFQHRDWENTERAITDANGNVTNIRISQPFGDGAANTTGSRDNTYDGFTGLWDGAASSTNHAQYREYSNIEGRWLSPDPYDGSYDLSNPQSLNRYAYVRNNPLSRVDPTGLKDLPPWYWYLGYYGGRGMDCTADGVDTPCGMVSAMLGPQTFPNDTSMGGAVQCPNNNCGIGTSTPFQCVGSVCGYMSIQYVATHEYEWGGVLYSADQWQTFLSDRVDAQRQALADAISYASGSPDGSNWDYIYANLQYVQDGTKGGNANFQWSGDLSLISFVPGYLAGGCEVTCRFGGVPSIHMPGDYILHLDSGNPLWGFGLGAFVHGFVDVLLGNINPSVPMGPGW